MGHICAVPLPTETFMTVRQGSSRSFPTTTKKGRNHVPAFPRLANRNRSALLGQLDLRHGGRLRAALLVGHLEIALDHVAAFVVDKLVDDIGVHDGDVARQSGTAIVAV